MNLGKNFFLEGGREKIQRLVKTGSGAHLAHTREISWAKDFQVFGVRIHVYSKKVWRSQKSLGYMGYTYDINQIRECLKYLLTNSLKILRGGSFHANLSNIRKITLLKNRKNGTLLHCGTSLSV